MDAGMKPERGHIIFISICVYERILIGLMFIFLLLTGAMPFSRVGYKQKVTDNVEKVLKLAVNCVVN